MSQLKNSIEKHALNETDMLARIRLDTQMDTQKKARNSSMQKRVWLSAGVAAAMFIAVIANWGALEPVLTGTPLEPTQTQTLVAAAQPAIQNLAYAMVSIDINPSLELYTNISGDVIEIKAKNNDAKSLNLKDLVGQPAEAAVITIIQRVTQAGFIKPEDTTDDYVVISEVILDENDADAGKNLESLGNKIQQAVAKADMSSTTKVAVIKATLREKFEAENKNVPLGLYIINGMIDEDHNFATEDTIKVSEFVKEKKNVDQLAKRAAIISTKEARKDAKANDNGKKGDTAPTTTAATTN